MRKKEDMHGYQNRAVSFIKKNRAPDTDNVGLFIEMGLGKTVCALTAIDDLINEYKVRHALIIAPLRVANEVWKREVASWDHLSDLTLRVCTGSDGDRRRHLNRWADVYTINRENIPWLVNNYQNKWKWDMIVIDESTSFKNMKSKRFRALLKVLSQAKKRVILTGTPSPKNLLDLWSQMYIVDEGERLGKTMSEYKQEYFVSNFYKKYDVKAIHGADEDIFEKLKDVCLSMQAKDYLELPKVSTIDMKYELTPKQKITYKKLEKELGLQLKNGDEITAFNAAAITGKLLQFTNGFLYDEDKEAHHMNNDKCDILSDIIDENPNENLIVCYNFKEDLIRLKKRFPQGKTLDKKGVNYDAWNRGEIKLLFIHPASAGHGLNLQHGGSTIIWYGLTWSLENYLQANARVNRQGQTKPVRIFRILAQDTKDEDVVGVIEGRKTLHEAVMNGLE